MAKKQSPRTATTKDKPVHVPTPAEEDVRRGAPSARMMYLQDDISQYRHKDGQNRIRFLAWKDGVHFFYYLWVHRNIGIDNHAFACLLKNKVWREPCPICEDIDRRLKAGEDWNDLKEEGILLGQNPRILAQVIDRDNEEQGIQIWDVTAWEIDNAITLLSVHEDTGETIQWTDPVNGRDLIYNFDSKSDFAMPKNLRRSDKSSIDVEFYRDIMDFEKDVIYKSTYNEIAEYYDRSLGDWDEDDYEDVTDEPETETEEEEEVVETVSECMGKDFGQYSDCTIDACGDFEKCKEIVEGKSTKEEEPEKKPSPRRRR
jgi:hypothetical protein